MTAPNRRWFRFAFSLRTLFVVVTVLCLWLGWNVQQVQERGRMATRMRGGVVNIPAEPYVGSYDPPLVWRLTGAKEISNVYISPTDFNEREYNRIRRLFPEAEIGRLKPGYVGEWHASFDEFPD